MNDDLIDAQNRAKGRLKWDARLVAGGTPSTNETSYWTDYGALDGTPFVAIADMSGRDRIDATKKALTIAGMQSRNMPVGDPGTLLLAMYASVGEVSLLGIQATWNQALLGVTPDSSRVNTQYLRYVLLAMRPELLRDVRSTTQDNLNAGQIGDIRYPKPPLEEQRTIADYLDQETAQIDALVAKQEEFIGLLTKRRVAVVDSLVWSGLDSNAECSESGIGPTTESPKHWRRLRNKNIFREISVPSKEGSEELLTVSHLTGVTPRSLKNVNMFEAVTTMGYKVVEIGDLAINTMWAWMGALGVSKYRGIVSPAYGVYRPTVKDIDGRYFDYLFRTPRYVVEMTRHSRGITSSRLRLYPDVFLGLNVVLPPTTEQIEIADRIEDQTSRIDTLIAKAEEHITLAKERRAALITAAVTGQFDVRTPAQKVS